MAGTDKQIEEYNDFLHDWSVERMKKLSIDEYTNSNKTSFIYYIEFDMKDLGSMRGGSSFKFGIYKRKDTKLKKSNDIRIYEDGYAWFKKHGDTSEKAFKNVRTSINSVIENIQKNDLQSIEENKTIGETYKWKIAFHYQNKDNILIVPIFKREALKIFLKNRNYSVDKMYMSGMYKVVKEKYDMSTLEQAFELSNKIWNEYINYKNKAVK